MIKDLSVLDRLTQRITREGTSVFIRTYYGAEIVHEHELTNYPSGPIPDEVSTVAEAIRAGLATGSVLSLEQLAEPNIKGVAGVGNGVIYGEDGRPIHLSDEAYSPSQFIGAGSLSVFVGSPSLTVVANTVTLSLPDTSTSGFSFIGNFQVDVGYQVYVWLSGSSANASNLPVFIGYELQLGAELVTPTGGTSKFSRFVPPATANQPVRHQLPINVLRSSAGGRKLITLRLDRKGGDARDTYTGNLQIVGVELVPTKVIRDANITDGGIIAPTIYPTPYDGLSVTRGLSIYTPIWTGANGVYVSEPVTISGVQQSRASRLDKVTYAVIEDVQTGTNAHDSIVGHRDCSIAVDAANNVIVHPEAHYTTWAGKYGTAGSLASLTNIAKPSGADTNQSYRRFFRNPYNGDIWMGIRGNLCVAGVYKWNPSTKVFDRMGGGMLAGDSTSGASPGVGYYGMEIAFASATELYVTTEPIRVGGTGSGLSGYPRQNVSVLKSVDGGATFTTMRGMPIAIPAQLGSEGDYAFPSYNNTHNVVCARIAVTGGVPVVIAAWKHPHETYRGLWAAKWNSSTNEWDRVRLAASLGDYSAGNPHSIYLQNGTIYVVASSVDDHDNGNYADGIPGALGCEMVPANNQVYLYKSTNGTDWTRYTINHPAGGYGGGYLDPESIRIDGKIRVLPRWESHPSRSVVWELPLV